ncbi:ABC transporter substrate-binding protein, partial [uncultured Sulfitobacter sp.]|uniref:ABC transporter substrate-binding protein n=1 Tax=uncultured Sulfitobacter sp. TaxID=191468 RepID=UPI0030D818A1
ASATFKFISDPTAAFASVMAEDVDVFTGFPAPENIPQFEADPRFQVLIGSTEGETILSINNKREPFDNVKVREAVAHAIDRQAIIDGAMFGYGTPVGTHFAPHNPDYVDLTEMSSYDPEKSKALLAEAGFPDGFETTLHLPPPSYARRGGEIIAAQLAEVGIRAQITNVEWAQWLETVFKGKDFGLSIVSHTEPMDINIYANPDYYFQYDNAEFQSLIAEFNKTADPAARSEMLAKAQQTIAEDYVNGYLFQLAFPTIAKAGVQGLWVNAPTQATDLSGVSWAE